MPDALYNSELVTKFCNYIMDEGKKSIARRIVYGAFEIIKKAKKDPMEVFDAALKNAAPLVELKSRRVGGANYQVPREVRGERRTALGLRWIVDAARNKKGKPMAEKLAFELLEASQNQGTAVKKKQDTHRMAEANKAFAHFSW